MLELEREPKGDTVTTIDQIFQAIQCLPVTERLRLIERVAHELAGASACKGLAGAPAASTAIGWLADAPQAADEIERIAGEERASHTVRNFGDDQSAA
jgi:hypothetical protein